RRGPALLEPDRAGEGGRDDRAARGHGARVRRRQLVLPDQLRLRRRADGGVRLRARPARDLGRRRRDGVRDGDGGRGDRAAAEPERAAQHGAAARARDGVREHLAGGRRVRARLLGRRLRQCVRDGEDEGDDRGAVALDADDRLDDRRARGRYADLLPGGVRRHLDARYAGRGGGVQLVLQGDGRGADDAGDVCGRGVAEARGGRRLLRYGYGLYAVHVAGLTVLLVGAEGRRGSGAACLTVGAGRTLCDMGVLGTAVN